MKDIPTKKFTHKIIGLLYDIYNELGYGYREKYYQKAFAELLNKEKINYEKELYLPLEFQGKIIGKYFIDFVIEDNLVIELKVCNDFYKKHIGQILSYLKRSTIKLGLLILITNAGIKIKRLIL